MIHSLLALQQKPLLLTVGSDAGHTQQGLLELGVDGGAGDGLQPLQLTGGGHVESLRGEERRG